MISWLKTQTPQQKDILGHKYYKGTKNDKGVCFFYKPLRGSIDKIWAEVEYGKGTDHRHLCRTSFPSKGNTKHKSFEGWCAWHIKGTARKGKVTKSKLWARSHTRKMSESHSLGGGLCRSGSLSGYKWYSKPWNQKSSEKLRHLIMVRKPAPTPPPQIAKMKVNKIQTHLHFFPAKFAKS